jgi:hypothetical protein
MRRKAEDTMTNDQTTGLTLAKDVLQKLPQFVVTETVESCNGNKCRERWCCGCSGEDEATLAVAEACNVLARVAPALAAIDQALADRARQAPAPVEVSRLAEEPAWMTAFDEARDAIFNDRGPLEGQALTNDQTNAVLAILDDSFMSHLRRGPVSCDGIAAHQHSALVVTPMVTYWTTLRKDQA